MKNKILAIVLISSIFMVGCGTKEGVVGTGKQKYDTLDGNMKTYEELTGDELNRIAYNVFPSKEISSKMELKLNGKEKIESKEFSEYNNNAVKFIKDFIVSNNLHEFGGNTYQEYSGDLGNGSVIIDLTYFDWEKPLNEEFGRIEYEVNKTYSGKYTGDVIIEVSAYIDPEEYYNKPFIFEDSIFYEFSKNLLGTGIDYTNINRKLSVAFKDLVDGVTTTGWTAQNFFEEYDFVDETLSLDKDSKTYPDKAKLTYKIKFELEN